MRFAYLIGVIVLVGVAGSKLHVAAEASGIAALRHEHLRLLEELTQGLASPSYLVIDTYDNRVDLRDASHQIVRQVLCATGSGRKLEGAKPKYNWRFYTPKGRFSVLRKVADPIWIKPEWHFVESGEKVPVFAEDKRRFERGALGEYALYFLKDYMIHGTIFEVNLGKNITHGCIRVGREDLRYLYETVEVGCPVYIY
jgi:L,D-transpeptidase ErfK/SrfK